MDLGDLTWGHWFHPTACCCAGGWKFKHQAACRWGGDGVREVSNFHQVSGDSIFGKKKKNPTDLLHTYPCVYVYPSIKAHSTLLCRHDLDYFIFLLNCIRLYPLIQQTLELSSVLNYVLSFVINTTV